ncbi:MAG: metallophosphoesterase family protein [Cyanobacteriota bacterium]|nr:metallophosphoesterase family protein [Cyanobacteriota bacterium]
MTQRRIVIGDVHGNYEGLVQLLEEISPGADDRVYFLGDLIDRGPQSREVIELVMNSPYECLLGNHEQMMLAAFPNGAIDYPALQAWLCGGGLATLESYPDRCVRAEHLDWMQSLPIYLDLGDLWLAHAGVDPKLKPEEQTARESCWIRHEFHSHPEPYFPNKLIITGHTITFTLPNVKPGQLAAGPGWLGIDTGAYSPKSGWLTALDVTYQRVYQVNTFDRRARTQTLEQSIQLINPSQVQPRQIRAIMRSPVSVA